MTRRFRYLAIASVLLAVISWGGVDYEFNNFSPIEKVEIEGKFENISRDDFREKVVAVIDGGYFSLDLDKVRTALLALPWVDDVAVRRQWPSSLYIKVTEKHAVAYWNNDAMISDHGEVFRPETIDNAQSMPRLKGPEGQHTKVWSFLAEIDKEFSLMGFRIVDLRLDNRRAWHLHFISGESADEIEVKLGRDNADERLARFVRVFSSIDKFDLNNIAVIDLRYPNGFAMRIKNNIASMHAIVREV
ncbi:MAG: cell division protein FtsQ/DivIB [Gammaproteobacteria bacterium]|nr:cell division protein FtsQ/DivIB [Gammaproteobacteria bacterium]